METIKEKINNFISFDAKNRIKNPILLSYTAHKKEIDSAINAVLTSGNYILGDQVLAFEKEFSHYIGVNHGIGVGSGTEALHLSLKACDIKEGDEVITVSHTAVATIAAIEQSGAIPILVDISPNDYTIDPEKIIQKISPRTRAIVPVHLYGHPADMTRINDIALDHDLVVIEDCAQAHGATINGKKVGCFGDMAAFSFYPTKNLGAYGDGGLVTTNNAKLADRMRLLRQYGWGKKRVSLIPGFNSRLDELQASILRIKLKYLDNENSRRNINAQLYSEYLSDSNYILPIPRKNAYHAYHQYVIRTSKRETLKKFLSKHSINTLIHYKFPVHLQPAYSGRLKFDNSLPCTEKIRREILSLPMNPYLKNGDIESVAQLMIQFLKRHK